MIEFIEWVAASSGNLIAWWIIVFFTSTAWHVGGWFGK